MYTWDSMTPIYTRACKNVYPWAPIHGKIHKVKEGKKTRIFKPLSYPQECIYKILLTTFSHKYKHNLKPYINCPIKFDPNIFSIEHLRLHLLHFPFELQRIFYNSCCSFIKIGIKHTHTHTFKRHIICTSIPSVEMMSV